MKFRRVVRDRPYNKPAHAFNTRMISIAAIITTRDRARLLPRAVESVLAQSRPADEVIIVDDGSTDATADYLATLPARIRVLRQAHRGVSAARNLGVAAAESDWFGFLDDDDEWLPDKLLSQADLIARRPGFGLCHGEEIWRRRGERVNPAARHKKRGGWIYPYCLPRCVISPSVALIHRRVFDRVGLFDLGLPACEDYDLWLRVCARYPVLFTDTPIAVKHGGHDGQLSKKHFGMDRFRIRAMEKILAQDALGPRDRLLTLNALAEKTRIFMNGAAKRGKTADAAAYAEKLRCYRAAAADAAAFSGPARC